MSAQTLSEAMMHPTTLCACLILCLVACQAPAPIPTDARASQTVAEAPAPSALPQPLQDIVSPWHPIDPAWYDEAELVLVATYTSGSYPCIFHADGSSDMPMSMTFTVERVIKGSLGRKDFDFSGSNTPSVAFPEAYDRTRRYLVFIKPSPEVRNWLDDPGHIFTLGEHVQPPDLLGIIDLDQDEAQASKHKTNVATWHRREAFEFTPEGWASLRKTPNPSLETLSTWHRALSRSGVQLHRKDTIALLGPPDDSTTTEQGQLVDGYDLNHADRESTKKGTILGRITITWSKTHSLETYQEDYLILDQGVFRTATYEEKRARDLVWNTIIFPY